MPHRLSLSLVFPRTSVNFLRAVGLAGVLLFNVAAVRAVPTFTTELSAKKRVLAPDAQGRPVESWIAFTKLLPGEVVTYTIACSNRGTEPATGIVVSLPVPAEMIVAVEDTPPGVEITCSIDGGVTFDRLDRLAVTAPDGASRPARADDVNFVRWTLTAPLAPATTTAVSCRAVLK